MLQVSSRRAKGTRSVADVIIGVDAGGSKTVGITADPLGNVLARAIAGGANLRSLGAAAVSANLDALFSELCARRRVLSICVGAAGIDRPADRAAFESLIAPFIPPGAAFSLRHDAEIALRSATTARPAVVVIAGTGSFVYGQKADGTAVRAAGHGALIGDDGSAFSIGMCALRHAARAFDGVSRPDRITEEVARVLAVHNIGELINRVHAWPPDIASIAALAPIVGAEYRSCAAARRIVDGAGSKLGAYARSIAARVRTSSVLPVFLWGGAFDAAPQLGRSIETAVERSGPCRVRRLSREPALGALKFALEGLSEEPRPG